MSEEKIYHIYSDYHGRFKKRIEVCERIAGGPSYTYLIELEAIEPNCDLHKDCKRAIYRKSVIKSIKF